MTEAEWFAANDAQRLARIVGDRISPRKLRLFMVAWARRNWDRITIPIVHDAIELAEQFADGKASKKQLEALYETIRSVGIGTGANYLIWPDSRQMAECVDGFCRTERYLPTWWTDEQRAAFRAEQEAKARMFRDIVGNPFRPVAFDPAWRTTTAVQIARQMYESREFSAMPILADALQDAGCDDEDVLTHCRDPQAVHIRGCWVVDLVLGKS